MTYSNVVTSEKLRILTIPKRTASRNSRASRINSRSITLYIHTHTNHVESYVNPTNPSSSHHLHFFRDRKSKLLFVIAFIRHVDGIIDRSFQCLSCQMPSIFSRPFKTTVNEDEPRGDSLQRIFHRVALSARSHGALDAFGDVFVNWPLLHSKCTPRCLHSAIYCGRWFSVYANTSVRKTLEEKYSTWYHIVLWRYSLIQLVYDIFHVPARCISSFLFSLLLHITCPNNSIGK